MLPLEQYKRYLAARAVEESQEELNTDVIVTAVFLCFVTKGETYVQASVVDH